MTHTLRPKLRLAGKGTAHKYSHDHHIWADFAAVYCDMREGVVGHCFLAPPTVGTPMPFEWQCYTVPYELTHLYVQPVYRKMGLATQMIRACQKWAWNHSQNIVIRVRTFRTRSMTDAQLVQMYMRFGFGFPRVEGGDTYMVWRPDLDMSNYRR